MITNSSTATTFNKEEQGLFPVYLWMLSYFKRYQGLLYVLIFCGLIITTVQLSIPKVIRYFIDVIIPYRNTHAFLWIITGLSLAVIITFGIMAFQNILRRTLVEKASRDLHFDIFKHFRTLGFAYFEQHPIGESLSYMNTEVTSMQNFYRSLFPGMIQATIFSFVSIGLMISMSFRLTIIMFPCLLIYYLAGPYFERKASLYAKEARNNRVLYSQKVYESISALGELRANHVEEWDKQRLLDKLQKLLRSREKGIWFSAWRGTIRRLSYYIGGIVVIIYGIYLVQNNQLSVGEMAAFLLYYFQVMQTITGVITLVTEQKLLMAQADKLYKFIKTEPDVKETSEPVSIPNPKGEIVFRDVSFHYPDRPNILQHFNLHIKPGQRVALVGASGNGKSTILKLMVRFYDPQQGEILLDGIPLHKLTFAQLRLTIGYVFQETYLFGASVRDNILFGQPEAAEAEVIAAAKAAYAHDFIMELPDGYDTLLGERGMKLSGGQKQRISIARMLIKNPLIVLLDEATSALDNVSEREVQVALDRLLYGRTTITVAHRLSTVQNYDKIAVISDGNIVEFGSHNELMHNNGYYYQLIMGEEGKKSDAI
jgi:ATP-binding cassette subfamily B protein/subfamily B ATP-binding cassette protein MsbA